MLETRIKVRFLYFNERNRCKQLDSKSASSVSGQVIFLIYRVINRSWIVVRAGNKHENTFLSMMLSDKILLFQDKVKFLQAKEISCMGVPSRFNMSSC